MPALVTVNVEPRSSSGLSAPSRAASARRSTSAASSSRSLVAGADHGNDEAVVCLHGDAEVVAVEVDDLLALEAGVQLRELAQALGDRLQHRRHEALEVDRAEVALLDPGDRRHRLVRAGHVLGDEPPHPAEPLAPALAGHVLVRAIGRARAADVLFGHASLWARPLDPLQVDAELLGKAPDERGRPRAALRSGRRRLSLTVPVTVPRTRLERPRPRRSRPEPSRPGPRRPRRPGCARPGRRPATGSRRSSCRSGSRRADRPRRPPGPRSRASGRPRPPSVPRRDRAA